MLWCVQAEAATKSINYAKIIIELVPLLLFVITFVGLMRWSQKKTSAVNDKIVESNEEVARQIKRIADHLEKDS